MDDHHLGYKNTLIEKKPYSDNQLSGGYTKDPKWYKDSPIKSIVDKSPNG